MEIVFGVPQGSILGLLLFSFFLADLLFIVNSTDIANYANDNMPYATANDIDSLIASLEEASMSLFIKQKAKKKNKQFIQYMDGNCF